MQTTAAQMRLTQPMHQTTAATRKPLGLLKSPPNRGTPVAHRVPLWPWASVAAAAVHNAQDGALGAVPLEHNRPTARALSRPAGSVSASGQTSSHCCFVGKGGPQEQPARRADHTTIVPACRANGRAAVAAPPWQKRECTQACIWYPVSILVTCMFRARTVGGNDG